MKHQRGSGPLALKCFNDSTKAITTKNTNNRFSRNCCLEQIHPFLSFTKLQLQCRYFFFLLPFSFTCCRITKVGKALSTGIILVKDLLKMSQFLSIQVYIASKHLYKHMKAMPCNDIGRVVE